MINILYRAGLLLLGVAIGWLLLLLVCCAFGYNISTKRKYIDGYDANNVLLKTYVHGWKVLTLGLIKTPFINDGK